MINPLRGFAQLEARQPFDVEVEAGPEQGYAAICMI